MYLNHFGLERPPFKITPDTSLFYEGGNRGAALEAVKYAILQGEGIIKVVGEVGSGKTMLCRMLEIKLPDYVEIVYLANPSLSPEKILHVIAMEMKLPVDQSDDKARVMQQLQEYLLDRHAKGRQVVVFIEEAQGMPLETLEEIRLLSNLETDQFKMLQIVLFGQPELDENLAQRQIRQLRERITHHLSLDIFDKKDIQSYLNFRLRAAGYKDADLFNARLAGKIAQYSKGLTRRINILADKTLLAAYADNSHQIKAKHIKMAAKDSQYGASGLPSWLKLVSAAMLMVILVSIGWFGRGIDDFSPAVNQSNVENDKNAATIRNNSTFSGENEDKQLLLSEPSHDLFRQSLMAASEVGEGKNDSHYSIQLMMFEKDSNRIVKQYLNELKQLNLIEKAYIYPSVVNHKKVLHLAYGQYENYTLAEQAVEKLPESLKKARPFIRSIESIKKEIAEQRQ